MINPDNGISLPYIPDDLLDSIDTHFPDKCPSITEEDRMIWFKAGQRSVVEFLKDQSKRQKESTDLDVEMGFDLSRPKRAI